ncbi:MAG: FecR domain-containing protein [Elusimicrobia bacterium]|nr:FecR domain-containing protein [Elusimicrobiota bacterium]
MTQDNEDLFWSEVGAALAPARPEAAWTAQRRRILSGLRRRGPSPVLAWVGGTCLAGAAAAWLLLPRQQGSPAPEPPAQPASAPVAAPTQVEPQPWDARITLAEGEASVIEKDSGQAMAAVEGMPLEEGDVVRTGRDGKAELALSPESVIVLGPNSSLTLSDLDPKRTALGLGLGSLLAKLRWAGSPGRRLDVITPAAVAAVRGTEFGLSVMESGETTVGVFDEGKVAVRAKDAPSVEETMLSPRQEVHVSRGAGLQTQRSQGRSFLRVTGLARLKSFEQQAAGLRQRPAALARTWKSMDRPARAQLRGRIRQEHLDRLKSRPQPGLQRQEGQRLGPGVREQGDRGRQPAKQEVGPRQKAQQQWRQQRLGPKPGQRQQDGFRQGGGQFRQQRGPGPGQKLRQGGQRQAPDGQNRFMRRKPGRRR